MKYTFFTALLTLLSMNIILAQQFNAEVGVTVISEADVPEAVLQAQAANFSLQSVRQWKKQEYRSNRNSSTQYLAIFNTDGQNVRARYTASGQGLSTYTNYRPSALPESVQQTLTNDYAGCTPTGAAHVGSLQDDWAAFHIRLRKDGQKLTLWLAEEGQLINPREIPQEIESETSE